MPAKKNQSQHKQEPKEKHSQKETPQQSTKTVAAEHKQKQQAAQRVPISWRLFDLFFVICYLLTFTVIMVVFVARCNKILPSYAVDLKEAVCPALSSSLAPSMGTALDTYREWVDKVYNTKVSLAITCAHRMNTFVVAPLSLFLAYAFFAGLDCTKNWAMLHSCAMFYGMIIQDTVGWHALLDKHVYVVGAEAQTFFLVTFGFATFFPIVVLTRVWPAKPFSLEEYYSQQQYGCCDTLLGYVAMVACWGWLFGALIFYYEFCVKNVSFASGYPSVFDHSNEIWEQTAPHREAAMKVVEPYQDAAVKMGTEYANQGYKIVSDVGQKVVGMAQNMAK